MEYQIASISEKTEQEIIRLEDRIRNETGKDVVLIAYEPQDAEN